MSSTNAEDLRKQDTVSPRFRDGSVLKQDQNQHELRRRLLKLILDREQHRKNQDPGIRS